MSDSVASVIVVTHNGTDTLDACLESLRQSKPLPLEVIVIDNGSVDGSADLARKSFPTIRVFDFSANIGFAAGNNRGARLARGEFLFLLNQDARVEPDTIQILTERMQADEQIAVTGPKLLSDNAGQKLCSAGLSANRLFYGRDQGYGKDPNGFNVECERLGITGAAMMLRRSVFETLGGFDGRYFLYYEDLDLCIRARMIGYKVVYVPDAVATHPVKDDERPLLFSEFMDTRNRLRTMIKNLSWPSLARFWPCAMTHEINAMKNHLLNRRWQHARMRFSAWMWMKLYFFDTMRERRRIQRLRKVDDSAYVRFLETDKEVPFA